MEHHYDKLLRPRSLIRYYEELSRLSNDPEEQLLQKIRDGASEDVLESDLNMSFQKIADGVDLEIDIELAPDEQRNEGDKRRALARARVYDKALGEAKARVHDKALGEAKARVYDKALGEANDDTHIEEFLLRKLRTDDCLQKGGHCAMVDCSAARWNMVNIVLASIRWRDAAEGGRVLGNEELLAIAVEYGHVRLVQHLTKMQDVDVNKGSCHLSDLRVEDWKSKNERFTDRKKTSSNGHFSFLPPIVSAIRMGNVDMVMTLLACDRIDGNTGEPLHWAVATGDPDVVKELLKIIKEVDVNAVKCVDEHFRTRYGLHYSPLHLASFFGHASVVTALCEDTKGLLKANTENERGITALEIATEMKRDELMKILLERPEFAKQLKDLYRDRQDHVDAANAILVGAALIASVTFAGWLQPPLGYSAFFGSASIEVGAPSPSGLYPSFVSVAGHPIMQIFWFFNSMSFFFAIATLMAAATAARPPKRGRFIGELVRSMRTSLTLAYILLTISVGCVMGAFASAGFLVLPPIPKYTVNMGVTVGIGMMVVFLARTSSKLLHVL